jgi:transaldolase
MHAVADHSEIKGDQVRPFYDDAEATMSRLADAGIDYDDVIKVLIKEGVDKFIKAWDELLGSVDEALQAAQKEGR